MTIFFKFLSTFNFQPLFCQILIVNYLTLSQNKSVFCGFLSIFLVFLPNFQVIQVNSGQFSNAFIQFFKLLLISLSFFSVPVFFGGTKKTGDLVLMRFWTNWLHCYQILPNATMETKNGPKLKLWKMPSN